MNTDFTDYTDEKKFQRRGTEGTERTEKKIRRQEFNFLKKRSNSLYSLSSLFPLSLCVSIPSVKSVVDF
jgi:hypothetical protein